MGYCKHDWKRRNAVLQTVFSRGNEAKSRHYFVCKSCLRIRAVKADLDADVEPKDTPVPVGANAA